MATIHRLTRAVCAALVLLAGCNDRLTPDPNLNFNTGAREGFDNVVLTPADELTETLVMPVTTNAITPGKNYIYCATFQLAWNELCDEVAGSTVEVAGGPDWVAVLNARQFDHDDLEEDSYIVRGGRAEENTVKDLAAELKEKFPNATLTPPELPAEAEFFCYAYLAKTLAFENAFERIDGDLKFSLAGEETPVATFGFRSYDSHDDVELGQQVTILDYVSDDDFIVRLNTTSENDHMVLAKVTPGATLAETLAAVQARVAAKPLRRSDRRLRDYDSLRVPLIRLGVARDYEELLGKRLEADNLVNARILMAQQRILFQLDETGARLESDAMMGVDSAAAVDPPPPRHFDFNAPFLLYLQQADADAPYFAMWIETAEVLEPVEE